MTKKNIQESFFNKWVSCKSFELNAKKRRSCKRICTRVVKVRKGPCGFQLSSLSVFVASQAIAFEMLLQFKRKGRP